MFHTIGAIPVTTGQFSSTSLPLLSMTFNCNGSESSLLECASQVEEEECMREDAGVVCQSRLICLITTYVITYMFTFINCTVPSTEIGNCTTGDIRLVDGSNPLEGRVETCINNAWGTACNNRFSSSDADVVCKDLGYNFTDSYPLPISDFSPGSGPIFMDELSCEGGENRLLECPSAPLGLHSCTHDQDAAVRCVGM